MRKLVFVLALLLAGPAFAATRNCSAGLVSLGVCRVNTNRLLSYDLPSAAATELVDAVAAIQGCAAVTATTCSTPCTTALVSGGACSLGEQGTVVTISKVSFADATIRLTLLSLVRQYREDQAVTPARATARSTADPDISN